MMDWEQFRQELQDALYHIFDPDYQSPELLRVVLGSDPLIGSGSVQSIIIQAIEELKTPEAEPADGRAGRAYTTLHQRFVLGLTQEETAENLGLSVRHLSRVQREATHVLARHLWESRSSGTSELRGTETPAEPYEKAQTDEWRSQVHDNVALLQTSAPSALADIREIVNAAASLSKALPSGHDIRFSQHIPNGLRGTIHPSALLQVLISALGWLIRNTSGDEVDVESWRNGDEVCIVASGCVGKDLKAPNLEFLQELLASYRGEIDIRREESRLDYFIRIPASGDMAVLVIDDNPDMAYFYQRCANGTRYRIIHEREGKRTFDATELWHPNIIVLDIMLPDVDGWTLLSQLHQHPATRHIPLVVCSVIREQDLAHALGAVQYLAKPFSRREFLRALDAIVGEETEGASTPPEHTAAAGPR